MIYYKYSQTHQARNRHVPHSHMPLRTAVALALHHAYTEGCPVEARRYICMVVCYSRNLSPELVRLVLGCLDCHVGGITDQAWMTVSLPTCPRLTELYHHKLWQRFLEWEQDLVVSVGVDEGDILQFHTLNALLSSTQLSSSLLFDQAGAARVSALVRIPVDKYNALLVEQHLGGSIQSLWRSVVVFELSCTFAYS